MLSRPHLQTLQYFKEGEESANLTSTAGCNAGRPKNPFKYLQSRKTNPPVNAKPKPKDLERPFFSLFINIISLNCRKYMKQKEGEKGNYHLTTPIRFGQHSGALPSLPISGYAPGSVPFQFYSQHTQLQCYVSYTLPMLTVSPSLRQYRTRWHYPAWSAPIAVI